MEKINNFYKGKKIFITGHTGFKGSWLTSVLLSFGAKLAGYSLPDSKKKSYQKFTDYKKVKNIYGDIRNYKNLRKNLLSFNPEIIFHLAAQPLVSQSYIDPVKTIETNIMGSVNIMQIAREVNKLKSLVIITSDKCYLNKEIKRGYHEQDELGGKDPYSASKAATEIIFHSYANSFFDKQKKFAFATTRAGNVIGGGDWSKDRIIPDCIKSILKKKSIIMRNPKATRPWQHVLEPISGYLILAKKLTLNPTKFSGSWNFGPLGKETKKVQDIVNILLECLNLKVKTKIVIRKSSFKESNLLKLNSKKANKLLKWNTKWQMKESIMQTAFWYKKYIEKKDIKLYTNKQIKEYFKN